MARFFNHMCQAYGFVLNGVSYALIIDECFCYKQAAQLKDHTYDTWFSSGGRIGSYSLGLCTT